MSEALEITRPETKLALRPITPILGAEVTGLDLQYELDQPTVSAIRQAGTDNLAPPGRGGSRT